MWHSPLERWLKRLNNEIPAPKLAIHLSLYDIGYRVSSVRLEMQSVYALGDPRTGETRYIGIAHDVYKRYAQHLNHPHINEAKNAWMSEIKQAGIVPTLTILEIGIDDAAIHAREKHWIEHYLALGAILTNVLLAPSVAPANGELPSKEVAKRLRVSERTVFNLLKRGELTGFKVGRAWRIDPSDLEDYIRRQKEMVDLK